MRNSNYFYLIYLAYFSYSSFNVFWINLKFTKYLNSLLAFYHIIQYSYCKVESFRVHETFLYSGSFSLKFYFDFVANCWYERILYRSHRTWNHRFYNFKKGYLKSNWHIVPHMPPLHLMYFTISNQERRICFHR